MGSSLRMSFATSTKTYDADEDGAMDLVIGHLDGDDGLTLEERQELKVDDGELEGPQGEGRLQTRRRRRPMGKPGD